VQILVTNDDGVASPGLWALAQALRDAGLGTVTVIAPAKEQSGASMAFPADLVSEIFEAPVPAEVGAGIAAWAVSGTPVGCVTAAMLEAVGPRPALVVSGINRGLNTGSSVMISGTVGAAMVGAFWGVPGLAVSQAMVPGEPIDWTLAARVAARLVPTLLALPHQGNTAPLLNLNVPHPARGPINGIRQTTLSDFFYGRALGLADLVPGTHGRVLRYTFDRSRLPRDASIDTDDGAVAAGYLSVTPLSPMSVHPAIRLDEALNAFDELL
jgi:5'-nucleotidase